MPSQTDDRLRTRPEGKGSAREVERKFLIPAPPKDLERSSATRIEQGYVAVGEDGTEVRLRRAGRRTTLTVKSGAGRVRTEEELELDPERFARLWPLTDGRRLEKTRYEIPAARDLTIELDVYEGPLEGLVTAEVEFPSADDAEAFAPPAWFGREITDDRRYANQSLAAQGAPAAPSAPAAQGAPATEGAPAANEGVPAGAPAPSAPAHAPAHGSGG